MDVPLIYHRYSLLCMLRVHLPWKSEPVEWMLALAIETRARRSYKIEVVLNDVTLERLNRQRSVAQGHDEWMIDEFVPYAAYSWVL